MTYEPPSQETRRKLAEFFSEIRGNPDSGSENRDEDERSNDMKMGDNKKPFSDKRKL